MSQLQALLFANDPDVLLLPRDVYDRADGDAEYVSWHWRSPERNAYAASQYLSEEWVIDGEEGEHFVHATLLSKEQSTGS